MRRSHDAEEEEVETFVVEQTDYAAEDFPAASAQAAHLNDCMKNVAVTQMKRRTKHVRKEQLSQGVLLQLLKMFGRYGEEQEPCIVVDPFCGTGRAITTHLF